MMSVHNGESELRIPFNELSLCSMLNAKRNAGMPLPKIPVRKSAKNILGGTVRKARNKNGEEARKEILIRRHASSAALKPSNPFLINK